MIKQKKHLLVTIADAGYIDQAKQLFSSVYWNAGWKGDYMLLTSDMPESELAWFRDKGILVKRCEPTSEVKLSNIEYPPIDPSLSEEKRSAIERLRESPVMLGKFELFTPEFRKWDTILYLDSDIIVRYSLDRLTQIKGFWATLDDPAFRSIKNQFHKNWPDDPDFKKLENEFDLQKPAFNAGMMAFSTDVIKENTNAELWSLFRRYHRISTYLDQPIHNLYFSSQWNRLGYAYNLPVAIWISKYGSRKKVNGIVLHFLGSKKPWFKDDAFYDEWRANLDKADKIDLGNRPLGAGAISIRELIWNSPFFNATKTLINIYDVHRLFDRQIGLIGIFLKKKSPGLYAALKKFI